MSIAATGDCWALAEEVFAVPDQGRYLIYKPATSAVVWSNTETVRELQRLQHAHDEVLRRLGHAAVETLEQAGILLRNGAQEEKVLFASASDGFDPGGLSLFLTGKCSMRCVYCYANGGEARASIDWPTAKAAIDWIVRHTQERGRDLFHLSLHGGGEITTEFDLARQCVAYSKGRAAASGLEVRVEAGINGIANRPVLDWVAAELDGATISLDGLPEIQDRQRPFVRGGGTSRAVMHTLYELDRKGFRYGIRATVTAESVSMLPESVGFMARTFNPTAIQVEPVFLAGRAQSSGLEEVDPDEFVIHFRQAAAAASRHGTPLKYSGARLETTTNAFCKAAGNSLCVTPEGGLTSCYEVTDLADPRADLFFFGQIDPSEKTLKIEPERLARLRSLTVENKANCARCFCKWHCAGDCPAKLALAGNAWDPADGTRCRINQELTKDQLREAVMNKQPWGNGRAE